MTVGTDRVQRVRRAVELRFDLGSSALGWLALALAVVGVCILTLLIAADDVVERDGIAARDPTGLAWFIEHRSAAAVDLARVVTWLGSAPVLTVVVVAAGLAFWRRGLHPVLAAAPATAAIASVIGASVAKQVFGRPRPPSNLHLVVATEPAFPSGHSTSSSAVYLTIALVLAVAVLRRPLAKAVAVMAALMLAGAVELSRLTLGVHWPSDVIAGWALGTLIAVLVSTSSLLVAKVRPLRQQPDPVRCGDGARADPHRRGR